MSDSLEVLSKTMNRQARPNVKPKILQAAVGAARKHGLQRFMRKHVAASAGVAESTVSFHFKSMQELRKEVVKHAIDNEVLPILADLSRDRNSQELREGKRISAELKQRVAEHIAQQA